MPAVLKPFAVALCLALALPASAAEKVEFSRDVLPILSANCFLCHGRDPSTREAKLRLDLRDHATTERDGFTPIAPGKPELSEILSRITSKDEDERMPPADKGRALNAQEIDTIRQWIAQGAEYTEHWAFLPPKKSALPVVKDTAWPKSPIDRFILAKLEKENLKPATRANRETLLRRATLDLVGLPPTAAEVEAFANDKSPDAYAKLIDRLLASPHYGERWGRHWLDIARYADSGGFETDIFFGHAWRYRDYVIRSFNADKPFNQFIKEQVAGDELFPGNEEAMAALGLYTTGPVLQEAGMVSGKLEYDQNTDFVDTTGAAFLGLTVACARCHDHKYDPVSQKEYFSLQAIFNASDQMDFDHAGKKLRDRAALKNTQKEFEAEQSRIRAQREKDPLRRGALLAKTGDAYIEADPTLKARLDASKRYDIIRRAVEKYERVVADGAKAQPPAVTALLDEEDGDDNQVIALKAALRGILIADRKDPTEAELLNVGVTALLNPPAFVRGQFRRPNQGGNPPAAGAAPAGAPGASQDNNAAAPRSPMDQVIAAVAAQGEANAAAQPGAAGANPNAEGQRTPGQGGQGRRGFMSPRRQFAALQSDAEKRDFLLKLGREQLELKKPEGYVEDPDAMRREIGEKHLHDASPIPLRVLAHKETVPETKLLKRGELEMPGEVVGPGVPERFANGVTFEGVPANRRRAVLADWIASDKNLFTARVIANRVWQWHFGEAIVRTPNDFGVRGDIPAHPELLDWLAIELVEHGWSLKHLHRVIMLSAAYQMAGDADAETLERDPENRFISRFQPHRLQAEVIWDNIRAASGKLDLTMYGLPIAPPLDEQEQLGNYRKWPASTPEESNRRAIYILVKRSFRFPMLSAFDLPDNISSCGRRDITTVPNQALTLLNNRTMREQAAAFANRVLAEAKGDIEAVPARAWLHAYSRAVSPDERKQAVAFIKARTVNGDPKPAVAELCLAIFNTNEFIYQQ